MFVFILCLKQIFLGTTKFWGTQIYLGGNCPQIPPWLRVRLYISRSQIALDQRILCSDCGEKMYYG